MSIQDMLQEKHKERIEALKDVVFDTLGDLIPPEQVKVVVMGGGKLALVITGRTDVPVDMIMDEWVMQRKDTEFNDVDIYGER